jgi:hypothetical protein
MDITTTTNDQVSKTETSTPSVANPTNIQWAGQPAAVKPELQEQYDIARARNWINERMISQSQKHWNCTRDQAIERLLAQHKK